MKNIGLNPMNCINIPLSKIEGRIADKYLQFKKLRISNLKVFVLSENKEIQK
jgi:hypothetical protein